MSERPPQGDLEPAASKVADSTAFDHAGEGATKRSYYEDTKLMQRIGKGSYGLVHLGKCNGEEVAVKVMPLLTNTAKDIEREIKAMRECNSLNTIRLLDAFKVTNPTGEDMWIVMELCRVGSTLDMMRRQGKPFAEQQIAWVIKGLTQALFFLHTTLNLIHRDIKVAN